MKTCYVYILASKRNGTLYVGVTNDLIKRVWQHKNDVFPGFTSKYKVHRLVYYEQYGGIRYAIEREATQEVEQEMETRTDREDESKLE